MHWFSAADLPFLFQIVSCGWIEAGARSFTSPGLAPHLYQDPESLFLSCLASRMFVVANSVLSKYVTSCPLLFPSQAASSWQVSCFFKVFYFGTGKGCLERIHKGYKCGHFYPWIGLMFPLLSEEPELSWGNTEVSSYITARCSTELNIKHALS